MATASGHLYDENLSLPDEFRYIPILALRITSRKKLASKLDSEGDPLVVEINSVKYDTFNDIFGLSELAGMDGQAIKGIQGSGSPTLKFLEDWNYKNATIGNLWELLMVLERVDVIRDCRRTILRDCREYEQQNPPAALPLPEKNRIDGGEDDVPYSEYDEMRVHETKYCTTDDVNNKTPTVYDAFVCYTDKDAGDFGFVKELIRELEGRRGLKLFVPGRDDLPGAAENVISAYLIEKRCRKLLIIISNMFLRSAVCDFQVRFAQALHKDAQNRRLITVIREKGVFVPRILRYRAHCDFTKIGMKEFAFTKLVEAIREGGGISKTEDQEDLEQSVHENMEFCYPACGRWDNNKMVNDTSSPKHNETLLTGNNDSLLTGHNDTSLTKPKIPFSEKFIFKKWRNFKERFRKGKREMESESVNSHQYLSSNSCNLSSCMDNNHVLELVPSSSSQGREPVEHSFLF